MATITERKTSKGKRRYQVQIRRKGRPTLIQTFPNKTLAKEWARQIEGQIHSSRFLRRVEEEKHSLGECIDRYEEEYLEGLSKRERLNRTRYLKWWKERIGELALSEVTPAVITETRAKLLKKVSGPTSNRYLAALSALLMIAEKEWMWIDQNPVRKIRRRPERRGRVRFLSKKERKKLLEVCEKSSDPRLYALVLFALTTGARKGELLGIKWSDVDLKNRRARLQKTKNKDRRTISFPGPAGDLLKRMSKTPHISGYVFANAEGKPLFREKPRRKALAAAKIDDFRFHDLRHTAASYLAMSGATLPELAAFLGHRTLAMVQRYAHLTEPHSESVAERMVEEFLA